MIKVGLCTFTKSTTTWRVESLLMVTSKLCLGMMTSGIIGAIMTSVISIVCSSITVVTLVSLLMMIVVWIPVLFLHFDLTVCSQLPMYSLVSRPTASHYWDITTWGLTKISEEMFAETTHYFLIPVTTLTLTWLVDSVIIFVSVVIILVALESTTTIAPVNILFSTVTTYYSFL